MNLLSTDEYYIKYSTGVARLWYILILWARCQVRSIQPRYKKRRNITRPWNNDERKTPQPYHTFSVLTFESCMYTHTHTHTHTKQRSNQARPPAQALHHNTASKLTGNMSIFIPGSLPPGSFHRSSITNSSWNECPLDIIFAKVGFTTGIGCYTVRKAFQVIPETSASSWNIGYTRSINSIADSQGSSGLGRLTRGLWRVSSGISARRSLPIYILEVIIIWIR